LNFDKRLNLNGECKFFGRINPKKSTIIQIVRFNLLKDGIKKKEDDGKKTIIGSLDYGCFIYRLLIGNCHSVLVQLISKDCIA
jgi:hypothetical protein